MMGKPKSWAISSNFFQQSNGKTVQYFDTAEKKREQRGLRKLG